MRFASALVRSLMGCVLVASSLAAQAGFSSAITVQLLAPGGLTSDPTPINVSQTVAVADLATGISLAGGGDVGNYLLTGERVYFGDGLINLKIGVGDDTSGVYTTGYLGDGSGHARYVFDNLDLTGLTISGFDIASSSGFASPASVASLVHLLDPHTLTVDLDTLEIAHLVQGSSNNFAQLSIRLLTRDAPPPPASGVPEPASLSLFLIAALGALRIRRPRR